MDFARSSSARVMEGSMRPMRRAKRIGGADSVRAERGREKDVREESTLGRVTWSPGARRRGHPYNPARMGRRLLRLLVIALVLLLLGGLWAFSFFLFNPFEGKYDYAIASLIPREVDFYASKNELRSDFDPFPTPAFLDELEATPEGQALLDLGVREMVGSWGVEAALAELDTVLAQLPVRVDPLGLFGGKGLAVAGHFAGPELAGARWAV
jgi:hypothetical protein